jgi:glycosyltransferase involved in cell wall biosynthesis
MKATQQAPLGVSVVICCHNSAKLLPPTLDHLKAQQVASRVQWEVVLVDNASTDDTAEVARRCWPTDAPIPLRVISEPQIELTNARWCGFRAAKHEIISFIDDDNWTAPDWVEILSEVMGADPNLGAVGSYNEPVPEIALPDWFDEFAGNYYAIVRDLEVSRWGISPSVLCGAGMSIRKEALRRLVSNGFVQICTDRTGKKLTGCGDLELTRAIGLSGWRLSREPRLRLRHFLPARRLDWRYLRRLARSEGASRITLQCSYPLRESEAEPWIKQTLWWQVLRHVRAFLSRPKLVGSWLFSSREGDRGVIEAEANIGAIIGLLQMFGRYADLRKEAQNSRWTVDSQVSAIADK